MKSIQAYHESPSIRVVIDNTTHRLSYAEAEHLVSHLLGCMPHYAGTLRELWNARTQPRFRFRQLYCAEGSAVIPSDVVAEIYTVDRTLVSASGITKYDAFAAACEAYGAYEWDELEVLTQNDAVPDMASKKLAEERAVYNAMLVYCQEQGITVNQLLAQVHAETTPNNTPQEA